MTVYAENLISSVTVGAGGAANISFSSIPQTYTDLVIKFSTRADGSFITAQFNGDTGANYSSILVRGNGSTAASGTRTDFIAGITNDPSFTANVFANSELYIPNYAETGKQKTGSMDGVEENNATSGYNPLATSLWTGTAAISSIVLFPAGGTGTFAQYSTAYLYGITGAGYGAKATGGIITSDSNYYYHTFLTSGTFTPTQNLSNVDYLVIAGGGGGGNDIGGGGGAGGLRSTVGTTGGGGSLESKISLTASTAYTVTIGSGGSTGTNGTDSSIAGSGLTTITSTGGGAGKTNATSPGGTGGSGGGSGGSAPGTGGSGTANQGYAGGSVVLQTPVGRYGTPGGGGAGAVGSNSTGSDTGYGGNGGAGVSISAIASATGTGVSNYYAGGGGGGGYFRLGGYGGTGGSGGGGKGGDNLTDITGQAGTAGTANTGGGGGGGSSNNSSNGGGTGGSGIVIVRYAK